MAGATKSTDAATVVKTLTYGYGSSETVPIKITNGEQSAMTIESSQISTVNGASDTYGFAVNNNGNTIAKNSSDDTTYSIAIPSGLNVGTYAVEALLTDSYGNEFTEILALTVEPKTLTPTLSMNGWMYGETASEPAITGLDGLTAGKDYTITYYVQDSKICDSTDKPTTPGNYTVKLTLTNSNYKLTNSDSSAGDDKITNFTIAKNNKSIEIVAIAIIKNILVK